MIDIEKIQKFHEYVFGKNPAVVWGEIKKDPKIALGSVLTVAQNPLTHTMETGFILGCCLVFGLVEDPIGINQLVNSMDFELRIKENATRNKS